MGFEQVVAKVLDHEGGFVDDPADRGGMTFMGISRRWFPDEPFWEKIDIPIAYRSLQGVHFLGIYKSNRSQIRFIRGWLLNRAS